MNTTMNTTMTAPAETTRLGEATLARLEEAVTQAASGMVMRTVPGSRATAAGPVEEAALDLLRGCGVLDGDGCMTLPRFADADLRGLTGSAKRALARIMVHADADGVAPATAAGYGKAGGGYQHHRRRELEKAGLIRAEMREDGVVLLRLTPSVKSGADQRERALSAVRCTSTSSSDDRQVRVAIGAAVDRMVDRFLRAIEHAHEHGGELLIAARDADGLMRLDRGALRDAWAEVRGEPGARVRFTRRSRVSPPWREAMSAASWAETAAAA